MFDSLMAWLSGVINTMLTWVRDFFSWLADSIYSKLLDGLAGMIEAIPVPSFVQHAQSFFDGIPSIVVFFFPYFSIPEGIAFIAAALAARFLLRRIPFIG